jgi:mono/diheme cytochrome c family protein
MIRTGTVFLAALAFASATAACSSESDPSASASTAAKAAAPTAKSVTPEMLEKGKSLYQANCTACHGESGKGDGPGAGVLKPPPRDHTDYAYMSALTDKEIADVIKMGGAIKGRPLMPSHPAITGAAMDSLVAYIRTLSSPK